MDRIDIPATESLTGERVKMEFSSERICAPGNVRGWRASATTAMLIWDEPYPTCHLCPNAIRYEVNGEGITKHSVTRPPCEITGLVTDKEYWFHVTAEAAGNNVSNPGHFRLPVLLRPGKPGIPQVIELTGASVTLCWSPSYPEFESTRYRVYLNGFLVKQVAATQVSLTHLQSLTDYRIEVRAANEAGVSESTFMTFTTKLRSPANLRFSHRNGMCRLTWDPMFRIKPAFEVTINDQVFPTGPGRWGFNFKLSDLSPGPVPHNFEFKVVAVLDGVRSEASTLNATVADDVPPSPPGAPSVSDVSDTSATLAWEPSDDNVRVKGYRVVLNAWLDFWTENTHFTFNQLTSGAFHYVIIQAQDSDGNFSAPSKAAVFKTTGQAPSARPSPPKASITGVTSTSAKLEWLFQDDIPDSGVRILIDDQHYKDVLLIPSIVLKDLSPNVEYKISISLFDVYGQLSDPTILVYEPRDTIQPGTPANLRIDSVTVDSVTLSWEKSTDDVGVHGYVICSNHDYFDETPLINYTAVDLLPGVHLFEVCALDVSGNASVPAVLTVSVGPANES